MSATPIAKIRQVTITWHYQAGHEQWVAGFTTWIAEVLRRFFPLGHVTVVDVPYAEADGVPGHAPSGPLHHVPRR